MSKLNRLGKASCVLVALVFCSCATGPNEVRTARVYPAANDRQSTVTSLKPWERIYFKGIDARTESAGLPTLRDLDLPPDSREIRIWAGFDTSGFRGIVLSNGGMGDSAVFLTSDSNSAAPRILPTPKSGWQNLWEKLDDLRITDLPDPQDIAKIDEGSIVVEAKRGSIYRNYKYSGLSKDKGENHQRLIEVCKVVLDEFNIPLLSENNF